MSVNSPLVLSCGSNPPDRLFNARLEEVAATRYFPSCKLRIFIQKKL